TKDIVIRGGEKIPVNEIEDLLYRHAEIADAAVVAMPDERLGERACAFVTTRANTPLDLSEITTFLLACGMTKTYLPERLVVVPARPRARSGQMQEFIVREMAARLAYRRRGGDSWPGRHS